MTTRVSTRTLRAVCALGAAAALALTGCSAGSSDVTAGDDGLTELKVGVIPTLDTSALYLGIEEGIFEKHGLSIDVHIAEGGAAIIPAVVSGDDQIGYSNVVSSAVAFDGGIPITLIQDCCASAGTPELDTSRVLVRKDSGITDAAGLADANIAVNTLSNIGEVTIRMALENQGVPTDGLTFTQLAFSDMNDALERGDVDAIWQVSPNVQTALDRGFVPVLSPFVEATADGVLGHWFTSQSFAQQNPEVTQDFIDAMAESNALAESDPEAAKAVAGKELGIDEKVLQDSNLPRFPEKGVTRADVELFVEKTLEYGILKKEPDYDTFIWNGGK